MCFRLYSYSQTGQRFQLIPVLLLPWPFSSMQILAGAKNFEKWWGTTVVKLSIIFLSAILDGKYTVEKKAEHSRNNHFGCNCTCGRGILSCATITDLHLSNLYWLWNRDHHCWTSCRFVKLCIWRTVTCYQGNKYKYSSPLRSSFFFFTI